MAERRASQEDMRATAYQTKMRHLSQLLHRRCRDMACISALIRHDARARYRRQTRSRMKSARPRGDEHPTCAIDALTNPWHPGNTFLPITKEIVATHITTTPWNARHPKQRPRNPNMDPPSHRFLQHMWRKWRRGTTTIEDLRCRHAPVIDLSHRMSGGEQPLCL
jgi:hypothetical protein